MYVPVFTFDQPPDYSLIDVIGVSNNCYPQAKKCNQTSMEIATELFYIFLQIK